MRTSSSAAVAVARLDMYTSDARDLHSLAPETMSARLSDNRRRFARTPLSCDDDARAYTNERVSAQTMTSIGGLNRHHRLVHQTRQDIQERAGTSFHPTPQPPAPTRGLVSLLLMAATERIEAVGAASPFDSVRPHS